MALSGNTLYGIGGSPTNGGVFAIQTDGTGFTNLYTFTATSGPLSTNRDGAQTIDNGGLVLSGNTLYGTAYYGGSAGNGTVFAVNTNGSGFATLHSFTAESSGTNNDGANPYSGLVLSSNTLYGTAKKGGIRGAGTVFSISVTVNEPSTNYAPTSISGETIIFNTTQPDVATISQMFSGLNFTDLGTNTSYGIYAWNKIDGNDGQLTQTNMEPDSDYGDISTLMLTYTNVYSGTVTGMVVFAGGGLKTISGTFTTITLSPLLVTTTTLPNGTNGVAYGQTLTATGGQPPYNWTNISGTLPPGLNLATNGVISGTPTASGTNTFTVTVTDALSETATQSLTLNVIAPLQVTTVSLPIGTNGFGYNQQLTATNGQPPYSWSLLSGLLPTGLAFPASGLISGTPTTNGPFNFTVEVTDTFFSTATQALSLTISSPFIYTTSAGTITITGYMGPGGALVIPNQIGGLPVTSIGANAFISWSNLTSVTLPNGITSIGADAFYGCYGLTNVMIGNSVTNIGGGAFEYCTNLASVIFGNHLLNLGGSAFYDTGLTNVLIPSSVTSIGNGAFEDCLHLIAITVDSGNLFYSSTNGVLFNKSQTTLLTVPAGQFPNGQYGSYTIPSGVTNIGPGALSFCLGLYYVTIPNNVTSIGPNAFTSCSNLNDLTIPSSVNDIGDFAFASCPYLSGVYFRGNAPTADSNVFLNDNLTNFYLPCANGWSSPFGGMPAVEQNWLNFSPNFGLVPDRDNTFSVTFPTIDNCGHPINNWNYYFNISGVLVTNIVSFNQGFSFTAISGGYMQIELEVGSATNDIGERVYSDNSFPSGGVVSILVPVPDLVLNGDFETGNFTNWTLSGDTSWTFVDNGSQSGIAPDSGYYEAALGSGSLGYLSQKLSTIPGKSYFLSFWLDNPFGDPGEFVVSWNGKMLLDEVNPVANDWTNIQFVVSATGTNTVLQFGFEDDGYYYFGLDDVSVVAYYITPSVAFTANPTTGATPLSVQFTSSAFDGDGNAITGWNWNFGDGSTSTAPNPSHVYTSAGTFQPSLVATNSLGVAVAGSGPVIKAHICAISAPQGLVSWWTGDSTANDLVGTNNGVLENGVTFAPGEVVSAFSLNGVNQYISVPDNPAWGFGTNAFSIDLWANYSALGGSPAFLANDEGGGSTYKWIFWLNGSTLQLHVNTPSGGATYIGSASFSPTLGQWYHIALTRNATNFLFYINGSLVSSNASAVVIPTPNAPLTIGQAEGSFNFSGLLDEIQIYNRALSPAEIQAIYQAGTNGMCPPTPLMFTGVPNYSKANGVVLNASLRSGQSYRIQSNTNLASTNWIVLTNFTAGTASIFHFTNNAATNIPSQFYRIVSP
jgi:uncharacterized repeat protein (TIGR03803 family)